MEFLIRLFGTQFTLLHTVAKATIVRINKNRINKMCAAVLVVFAVSLFTSNAYAEPGKTILVLDASGSMWGKITDGYKIRVARNVVNELLKTLPAEQEIGLVAYGHREKDACNDIELLVAPAANTRNKITSAIESLDPKGKTPLSAAVIKAADELGIEENDATVILISDGEETCAMDPCAVSIELDQRGIDFVAHVVGFDVEKAANKEQLQCLAENTGGLFFSATDESELTEALNKISLAMTEAAQQVKFSATVQDHDNTPVISGVEWVLSPISSGNDGAITAKTNLLSEEQKTAEKLQASLDLGRYTLSVTRISDGVNTSLDIDLSNGDESEYILTLPPKASIEGPVTVDMGEIFDLAWEGPGDARDLIAIANSTSPTAQIISVFNANGENSTTLKAPTEPGEYELRYIYAAQRSVIATSMLKVEGAQTTLNAPDEANAGYSVAVDWKGPDVAYDAIVLVELGSSQSISETHTNLGNPAMVQMPAEPGIYELRYVLNEDRKVLASRQISVVEGPTKLVAPAEAGVGYFVNVDWIGPDAEYDFIAVAEVGASQYINKTDTKLGNPAKVQMPSTQGSYELRYVLHNGSTMLATRPITVFSEGISIDAPEKALAGDSVAINWVGPDAQHDTIAVAEVGAVESINEIGTYLGNPATVQMPPKPGVYELRYVLNNGRTTMATRPITVTDAGVSLVAPAEASVGETITVQWNGPDEPHDVIAIAEVGAIKNLSTTGTYLGNPTKLQMPTKPGDYEIRYVLHQGQTVMASHQITVSDAEVLLEESEKASYMQRAKLLNKSEKQ